MKISGDTKMVRKMMLSLAGLLLGMCFVGFGIYYWYTWNHLPDCINLTSNSCREFDYGIPVSGEIRPETVETMAGGEGSSQESIHVDFSKPFTMTTGKCEHYRAYLKLFGILPYKSVEIAVSEEQFLYPCGTTVGIYVKTEGVYVIDTGEFRGIDGETKAPAKQGLESGDYILEVNGNSVSKKQEFISYVEQSNGEELNLLIMRNEEKEMVSIKPEVDENGDYKVGIWIRDSAQGIGTLTYLSPDQQFGALGHGITDVDTGQLMELEIGDLYLTKIVGIEKGRGGTPGEITGMIHYVKENILGEIDANTGYGIFGDIWKMEEICTGEAMPIGYRSEVHKGEATIRSDVSGTLEEYDIEITDIRIGNNDNRSISITVTDPELLTLTGGIIQGMSGSPIIQDGKIVGAVTHVLVSNPRKGYGIFIETMLEH